MRLIISSLLCLMLAGCGLDETLHRADKPVSRESASRAISLPFPASTRDVYYVLHSGGMQEFQMFVRFTVDPKDLDSAVSGILSDRDKETPSHSSYPTLSLAAAPRTPVFPDLQPMPWWNPQFITNGFYRGSTNGQSFYLWVDVDQHTIYLCTHD